MKTQTTQNNHKKMFNLLNIKYCLFIGIWLLIIPPIVHAQSTMDSASYKIRLGNFNMTSGTKSSTSYNLTDTVGQIAAEFFSSSGYHVKAGFQYIYTLYDFSFSISSLAISLGSQIPNTFSTASNTLTVSAPGQGYTVTAYETSKLKLTTGTTIPDTTCDSGTCIETAAGIWTTPTNNGFGYNATGNDIATDFVSSSYFRPFPDFSASEPAATVMTTTAAGKNRVATITYKLSVSPSQAAGDYSTQIIYIATPVY